MKLVFSLVMMVVMAVFTMSPESSAAEKAWQQKNIWISFWCPPPEKDEAALARAGAEHFNLTWTSAAGLDAAWRHGLKVMLHDEELLKPYVLDDPHKKALLDATIEKVKHHPAMEAYFIRDEPAPLEFPQLARLVAYLRAKDPAHVAYINLEPVSSNNEVTRRVVCYEFAHDPLSLASLGMSKSMMKALRSVPSYLSFMRNFDACTHPYRQYLEYFIATVKPAILSYDYYPLLKSTDDKQFFLNLELMRRYSLSAHVPFINIIQASKFLPEWRMPNASELRQMVYSTLAYGGRGIFYFIYWGTQAQQGLYRDGKPEAVVPAVAGLNAEIAALSAPLMKLDSIAVYHTAPLPWGTNGIAAGSPVAVESTGEYVVGVFGAGGRTRAFMIVNRDYRKAAEAVLRVNCKKLREFDRASGKWRDFGFVGAGGRVVVPLAAGDGRLFEMGW